MSSTRESLCMCDLCRKRAAAYSRIEAFAAIRRAAAEARHYDMEARQYRSKDEVVLENHALETASAIRSAIRMAMITA